MDINIRKAKKSDLADIIKLLKNNNLPTVDIPDSSIQLYIGSYNDETIGIIGIEIYEKIGLLRSLAVQDSFKKLNVGTKLINKLFDQKKQNNIKDVYLLTETAEDYFTKFNFDKVDRSNIPDIIMETSEYKDICPNSAVVMHKNLIE